MSEKEAPSLRKCPCSNLILLKRLSCEILSAGFTKLYCRHRETNQLKGTCYARLSDQSESPAASATLNLRHSLDLRFNLSSGFSIKRSAARLKSLVASKS